MLFNSPEFIFLYLPVVLAGFFLLARASHFLAALWLSVASLFFYGWWNPRFVALLLASVGFNYVAAYTIARLRGTQDHGVKSKWLLATAITINLLLLSYYKYANFFIGTVNQLTGLEWTMASTILPLGISFFTFTQIAFLVDVHKGIAREYSPVHYLLFVTYFPHLIAGPVLHHKEMMPQFAQTSTYRFHSEHLSVGTAIFFAGLFKKVILADGLAPYADSVFAAPAAGITLTLVDSWGGALCYTLQLYFDFSGYSDMAIGLSRMFGIVLPLNFHSPYKSVNIIDFWRRWHMTLSRFLRDYLYIPLGGNRKGHVRRHVNLMITMLLGGLWHGAGWTFVVWGGLHGLYLVINHAWQNIRLRIGQSPTEPLSLPAHALAVAITFLSVVVAWVVFRADSVSTALAVLQGMAGMNGFAPTAGNLIDIDAVGRIIASLVVVWFAPNTQQIMQAYRPALDVPEMGAVWLQWKPSVSSAFIVWLLGFVAIINLNKKSAFLYFQF